MLVNIMNRLDHGISYSKVLEIRTTIANSKLSSSTTLIPNCIHQHIPTTAVYDHIDRLEDALSKSDTTHQVNEVLVHQTFIGPSLPPEKKKQNCSSSTCITNLQWWPNTRISCSFMP